MHAYVYTHIHTYIRMCTYIHTYVHTYVRTYIHICIHTVQYQVEDINEMMREFVSSHNGTRTVQQLLKTFATSQGTFVPVKQVN